MENIGEGMLINDGEVVISHDGIYSFSFAENENLRTKIVVEEGITATVNNSYQGEKDFEINILCNPNSKVHYYSYSQKARINKLRIDINEYCYFNSYILECGTSTDIDCEINLLGYQSEAQASFAAYINQDNVQNYAIKINHLEKKTISNVLCNEVLRNNAVGNFDVKSYIKNGCSAANSYQKTRILNLDDQCQVHIKPSLLINEYDVLGGHAATVSKVTPDELYYFASRGIDESKAKQLITLGRLLEGSPNDNVEKITEIIERGIKDE